MFYPLYSTQKILDGALFFDPNIWRYVEVLNLEESAGEVGSMIVSYGQAKVDENAIRWGSGILFPQEEVDAMVEATEEWMTERGDFESLPTKKKDLILRAAKASFAHESPGFCCGISVVVIDANRDKQVLRASEIAKKWEAEVVVSSNPEQTIRGILGEWGI